jgi:tRNA dimethylallyltransferase
MDKTIHILTGCTGCGKGTIARAVARQIGAEILSVDSMKVYRRMDIGTAKPTPEHRRQIPNHLIDVAEPSESFSVAYYVELADRAIEDIQSRGRPVLAVGGTILYLKALTEGLFEGPSADESIRAELRDRAQREGWPVLHGELAAIDPTAAVRIHPNDARRIIRALEVHRLTGKPISLLQTQWDNDRPRIPCRFIGLRRDKTDQSHRINQRVKRMIEQGLVNEVRSLLTESPPMSKQASQAVGYAEIVNHLEGRCTLDAAVEQIKINSRQLAKSQRTWLRRFKNITWFDLAEDQDLEQFAADLADRLTPEHT